MARASRLLSSTGVYHVMTRGAGRQIIFNDDLDRRMYLDFLRQAIKKYDISLLAWCLMDNHTHLLIEDGGDGLVRAIHYLDSRYAQHFNIRNGHIGPVFQGRFLRKPVESQAYMLQAIRYIHDNPCSLGIGRDEYRWSSYSEYARGDGLVDSRFLFEAIGGREHFEEFSAAGKADVYCPRMGSRMDQAELAEAARIATEGKDPSAVAALPVPERDRILRRMKEVGLSYRQIERLTGLGRYLIKRVVG